jgi:uncharacterized lipoprotein YddW (UPF0748 family)
MNIRRLLIPIVLLAALLALAALVPGQPAGEAAGVTARVAAGVAAASPAASPAGPVPFDADLWAALGHEAWYFERGYVDAPPPAFGAPGSLPPGQPPGSQLPRTSSVQTPPPSESQTPTPSVTPSPGTPSATPSATATLDPSVSPSATLSPTPTATGGRSYLPLIRYEYVPPPTPTPTWTPSPTPTDTPIPPPTATPTITPIPANVEARALWITRFDWTCSPPCQPPDANTIRAMVANAGAAGFNMILFQIRGNGDAYYTPGLEPWSARLSGTLGQDPGWDPLAVMISEAHARGIQVHAYFNVYPTWLGTTAPPTNTNPLHPFWRWTNAGGSTFYWRHWDTNHQPMNLNSSYLWASPGNDWLVENDLVATAADLLSRYQVDGLHLDLVRYASSNYSCDPRSEARWGAACFTNGDYASWQRAKISDLVRRMYNEAVIPRNRHVALSAAVWWYPRYRPEFGSLCAEGYTSFYQDSQGWLADGIIDSEMPMMYGCPAFADSDPGTTNWNTVMRHWLDNRAGRWVFPGISSDMSFATIAARIAAERSFAAQTGTVPGHSLFSYGALNQRGYWDDLAAGPYAAPAVAPVPGWHP